jgi:uncharacterized protein (DUF433 family)
MRAGRAASSSRSKALASLAGGPRRRSARQNRTLAFTPVWPYRLPMNAVQNLRQVIVVDPEIMGGMPVFAGTRVPVQTLFDYLEGGDDLADFLEDFPSVSQPHALQVLELSKDSLLGQALQACA